MDSINRNQREDTRENLRGDDAIARIRSTVKATQTCFFCTKAPVSDFGGARPMTVQDVDDDGNLWFVSASDSRVNQEVAANPAVKLFFQGSEHSDFMDLNGRATIITDRAKIEELWEPMMTVWFTGGKDDPRISVIRVAAESGYYWDNKHGNVVAGIKMLIGAALGKTLDDSVQGRLTP